MLVITVWISQLKYIGTVVISPRELIIHIHETILPGDDIVQSTGSVTALYLKSAYLQDVTSKSFHLPKIPLQ